MTTQITQEQAFYKVRSVVESIRSITQVPAGERMIENYRNRYGHAYAKTLTFVLAATKAYLTGEAVIVEL